jgi:hypothetical protein
VAMKKAEAQDREGSLTPPKLRRPAVEVGNIIPNVRAVQREQGGKEDRSKARLGAYDAYRREMNTKNASTAMNGRWEDSLVVMHPPPNAENKKSSPVTGQSAVVTPGSSPRSAALSPYRKAKFEERYPHGIIHDGNGGASSVPPRRKLTSDEKYGIVRYENGSSSLIIGSSPKAVPNSAGNVTVSPPPC